MDRYGRTISQCFVAETDINEWLVAQGLALAYRRYSRDYIAAEDEARSPAAACGKGLRAAVGVAAPTVSSGAASSPIELAWMVLRR